MTDPTSVWIEADGASRGNPGQAAYGAVLKDAATGETIAERGEAIGIATNNVAEYRGLIAGLELYREHTPDAALEELVRCAGTQFDPVLTDACVDIWSTRLLLAV